MVEIAAPAPRPLIYCPGPDKWVTIGQYVVAVKRAKLNLDAEFKDGLTSWGPTTGRQVVRQFIQGVHDRINSGRPYHERVKGLCI